MNPLAALDAIPFTLTPDEPDAPLPEGERLNEDHELIGHKIIAVIEGSLSRLADGNQMVLITETRCWMVIGAESECDSEYPRIIRDYNRKETLHDWVSAADLLADGVITPAEAALLEKVEQEQARRKKEKQAEWLRAQLAELEGGAK